MDNVPQEEKPVESALERLKRLGLHKNPAWPELKTVPGKVQVGTEGQRVLDGRPQ